MARDKPLPSLAQFTGPIWVLLLDKPLQLCEVRLASQIPSSANMAWFAHSEPGQFLLLTLSTSGSTHAPAGRAPGLAGHPKPWDPVGEGGGRRRSRRRKGRVR